MLLEITPIFMIFPNFRRIFSLNSGISPEPNIYLSNRIFLPKIQKL